MAENRWLYFCKECKNELFVAPAQRQRLQEVSEPCPKCSGKTSLLAISDDPIGVREPIQDFNKLKQRLEKQGYSVSPANGVISVPDSKEYAPLVLVRGQSDLWLQGVKGTPKYVLDEIYKCWGLPAKVDNGNSQGYGPGSNLLDLYGTYGPHEMYRVGDVFGFVGGPNSMPIGDHLDLFTVERGESENNATQQQAASASKALKDFTRVTIIRLEFLRLTIDQGYKPAVAKKILAKEFDLSVVRIQAFTSIKTKASSS